MVGNPSGPQEALFLSLRITLSTFSGVKVTLLNATFSGASLSLSNATSRTILSTKSNVAYTLLPFLATMLPFWAALSNEISFF